MRKTPLILIAPFICSFSVGFVCAGVTKQVFEVEEMSTAVLSKVGYKGALKPSYKAYSV